MHFHTSAKTNKGLDEVFGSLAQSKCVRDEYDEDGDNDDYDMCLSCKLFNLYSPAVFVSIVRFITLELID